MMRSTPRTEPVMSTDSCTASSVDSYRIHICPTTGGNFTLGVSPTDRVCTVRSAIGQKLNIPKERINLLYRDSLLRAGSLLENGVTDGARLTLLPSVHSGLVSQKLEHPMLQALDNLTESQVSDFICGKSPLTLAMRLGDHMMVVQLQLSSTPPRRPAQPRRTTSCPSSTSSTPPSSPEVSPQNSPSPQLFPASSFSASSSSSAPRFAFPPTSSPEPRSHHVVDHDTDPACTASLFDSSALEEAKKSLSMKLKEFSQETSQANDQEAARSSAIIDSMCHLGRGVYSGTFSGTLNPLLQEKDGKPKHSLNTIVHILNDLLGASPQYAQLRTACKRPAQYEALATQPKQPRTHDYERTREENFVTRGKVERLQRLLEQRRRHRMVKTQSGGQRGFMEEQTLNTVHGMENEMRNDTDGEQGAVVS